MLKLAAALTTLLAAPALAFVPWTNPTGVGGFFSWSEGGSDNGRFGSPIAVVGGDTFILGSSFSMLAGSGQTVSLSDRMQVDLDAFDGSRFDRILFHETIHYTITGEVSLARLDLTHAVLDLDNPARLITATISPLPTDLAGSGMLTFSGAIDLSQAPDWTNLHLVFDQTLTAQAGPNGSVQLDATLFTFQVPAPGGALVLGGALFLGRRRTSAR